MSDKDNIMEIRLQMAGRILAALIVSNNLEFDDYNYWVDEAFLITDTLIHRSTRQSEVIPNFPQVGVTPNSTKELFEESIKAKNNHGNELPSRIVYALRRGGFKKQEDRKRLDEEKVLAAVLDGSIWFVTGIGKTSVTQICDWLQSKGHSVKKEKERKEAADEPTG
jgi:hypothetical protein